MYHFFEPRSFLDTTPRGAVATAQPLRERSFFKSGRFSPLLHNTAKRDGRVCTRRGKVAWHVRSARETHSMTPRDTLSSFPIFFAKGILIDRLERFGLRLEPTQKVPQVAVGDGAPKPHNLAPRCASRSFAFHFCRGVTCCVAN